MRFYKTIVLARPRILLTLMVLFLAAPALTGVASAQSGKLTGRVLEAATGEPLPGVNVFLEGTTQGASTDFDGNYVIIGVRPGTYNLIASFISFATQKVEGVQVSLDLTTTINFELSEQVIENEEIVITADAVTVQKDLTSSESRITADTIEKLPVTELGQILEVQAGVTNRGGLHIRGGRSSEIVFMVDGVPVSDSYDGSNSIQLENAGIQELQVVSGTFNAEYGNAMSGVINIVTKEGRSDRFGGTVKAYTGAYAVSGSGGEDYLRGVNASNFTSHGVEYRDVDPYSYLPVNLGHFSNLAMTLEGPVVSNKATLFLLGRYFKNDGWFYGANIFNTDGTPGDSTLIPMDNFEKFSWQGNLKYRLTNSVIFNLSGQGSTAESRSASFGRRWAPQGRGRSGDDGYNLKMRMTHLLSNTTFYTLDFATFYREIVSGVYDDFDDPRYTDFDINTPDSVCADPDCLSYASVLTGGGRFARGGTDLVRFTRSTRSYLLKGDISSQIGLHHLIKGGFQYKRDDLGLEGFLLIPQVDENGATLQGEDFVPRIPDSNSSAFLRFDGIKPASFSAYVQDKIEYESFIVNVGLRYDYFDSRSNTPADIEDPNIYSPLKKINQFHDENGNSFIDPEEERDDNRVTRAERETYWWKGVSSKSTLSPRLGVAYPITDQGVIHFSYGLFFQIPTNERLFAQFGYKIPSLSGTYGPYGNPDLEPQKTSMYELGLKQGFGEFVIDVTGYYRDVRNWVSTSPLILTGLPGVSYVVYANRDYANTRGLTVSFRRNFVNGWGFDASYTAQVAEGSNSNPADEFFASQGNAEKRLALLPLGWDQRHKVAGAFYLGGDNWGSSTRFRVGSGFPYTPSFVEATLAGNDVPPEYATNSRRIPTTWEFDFNIYYEFDMGSVRPRIFVDVFNIFDRRNVTGVYSDTGEPDVTLQQFQLGAFDPGFWVRPFNYTEPRRIQAGIEFKF